MENKSIKNHWESWANQFKEDLRATTKTPTIKKLEISALNEAVLQTGLQSGTVMEVGCGNGFNCLALAQLFPDLQFTGIDFVEQMIYNAELLLKENPSKSSGNLKYFTGDVLDLEGNSSLEKEYDVIFTDRCLINLSTDDLQIQGIVQIMKKLKKGGFFIMLENMRHLRQKQNDLRKNVGLTERSIPEYNHFMDENLVLDCLKEHSCELLSINDFGSLHDLVLYVLIPMVNNGEIAYEHPMVEAVTELALQNAHENVIIPGIGQNRLYVFRKN